MILSTLRMGVFILSVTCALHAAPDISNLNNCIKDVLKADNSPPTVPTFDPYRTDFTQLIADLESAVVTLPHVYKEAAAKPLIQYLENLGEETFLQIFSDEPYDEQSALLQQIIPDAALSIIYHEGALSTEVNAFQEIVSDLYDAFLGNEVRVGNETRKPINPPTYGAIPPLVKFGNPEDGPYTWPTDATNQILGMHCAIVNLPPAQAQGGLLAWSCLGHETSGHDVTHADAGLLNELAKKVSDAVYAKFKSKPLANYWSSCIDESAADVLGYLNMGPSAGVGLIGYFRALSGRGKLSNIGYQNDPHPIDLLRGYLAAAVVKRLKFKGATEWSEVILKETRKDNDNLYLVNQNGRLTAFPVSLQKAIESTDIVAQVIMQSKLSSLQQHSLQELEDWKDSDQQIVDNLVSILKTKGKLPSNLQGGGFNAAYIVASATQAALEKGANIGTVFNGMVNFLAAMHLQNPTWSLTPTDESYAQLSVGLEGFEKRESNLSPHYVNQKLPQAKNLLVGQL